MDGNEKRYLTLKKAAPEWCNLDCPEIKIENPDPKTGKWDGWLVISSSVSGMFLEDGNTDIKEMVHRFVKKSSEAFYKKYPSCFKGQNGFLINFRRTNNL